jgi:hypothetical protein
MATTTGTTYHYTPSPHLGVPHPRPLSNAERAAVLLHDRLRQLGIDPGTVVSDIGDETVGTHRLKLIGWIAPDGTPQVTSICLQVFIDNFRRVVPA